MSIRVPDYYEPCKLYSEEDACIEICNSAEYSLEEAIKFVESLGYKVKHSKYSFMCYDDWMGEWRGVVDIDIN